MKRQFVNENTIIYTGVYYVRIQEIMDHYDFSLDVVLQVRVGTLIALANTLKAEAA